MTGADALREQQIADAQASSSTPSHNGPCPHLRDIAKGIAGSWRPG